MMLPPTAEEYYVAAVSYADSGDDDFAINLFNKAIELDPTFSDAYNDRGASHLALQDFPEAEADFSKAIELVPTTQTTTTTAAWHACHCSRLRLPSTTSPPP